MVFPAESILHVMGEFREVLMRSIAMTVVSLMLAFSKGIQSAMLQVKLVDASTKTAFVNESYGAVMTILENASGEQRHSSEDDVFFDVTPGEYKLDGLSVHSMCYPERMLLTVSEGVTYMEIEQRVYCE